MQHSTTGTDERPHPERGEIGGIPVDSPPQDSLPRERVRPVSWSKVTSTWAATLAVVVALNIVAGIYLLRYTPNGGYWLIEQKWALVNAATGPVDWVIVGDSSCNQGIDTEVWNRALGGQSLNLCTFGSLLPLNDIWMLNALAKRVGHPRNVLVMHVYDVWQRGVTPELLGRIPDREVWSTGKYSVRLTPAETTRELLSRYVPLLAQSTALRHELSHPLGMFQTKFSMGESGYMREVTASPQAVEQEITDHLREMSLQDFSISAENRAALAGLREFADSHGVNVYLTNSPINDELASSPGFHEYVAPMHAELRAWAATSPRLHYVEGFQTYPRDLMQGVDHVIDEGARDLTQRIARLVQ
jgi:hypothetical protein